VNDSNLAARVQRLEAMSRGLTLECQVIGRGDDPLLYLERKAYLAAVRVAISGLEGARVVLAKARHRIERDGRYRDSRNG
jgi:hypothetical protein